MRPLELDFQKPRQPRWAVQALLLALALAFAGDVVRGTLQARQDVASLRERLAHAAASPGEAAPLVKRVGLPVSDDEIGTARETIRRLSTPWETLFKSLEAARVGTVTIVSVEPDPVERSVSIGGEARDYLAVLSFLANLREQRALRRVILARHDTASGGQHQPLRFTVTASWGAQP